MAANPRRPPVLTALAMMLAAMLLHAEIGTAQTQKPSLVGTWRLVSVTAKLDRGGVMDDAYGPHPHGLLTYTANGRVAGLEAHDGRKPLSSGDRESAPLEERAEAFSQFLSYAGSYKVAGSKLTHHIEASSLENDVNTSFIHKFRFQGPDRLILTTPPLVRNGVRQVQVKTWERVK
ncbi:MAG: lipocalin-like domain-containing protein [Acidobacteriia bacterium]|nr:lipocalin-like domain-containing protein [Terriglobia bacterium]